MRQFHFIFIFDFIKFSLTKLFKYVQTLQNHLGAPLLIERFPVVPKAWWVRYHGLGHLNRTNKIWALHCFALPMMMIKLFWDISTWQTKFGLYIALHYQWWWLNYFVMDIIICCNHFFFFQKIKFCKFHYMLFCSINIFLHSWLARQNVNKSRFIREIQKKIQTDQKKQKASYKWNFIYNEL